MPTFDTMNFDPERLVTEVAIWGKTLIIERVRNLDGSFREKNADVPELYWASVVVVGDGELDYENVGSGTTVERAMYDLYQQYINGEEGVPIE